jgi:hypothetical protein
VAGKRTKSTAGLIGFQRRNFRQYGTLDSYLTLEAGSF